MRARIGSRPAEALTVATLIGVLGVFPLASCAKTKPLSQAQFDGIADGCGLPRSAVVLNGEDEILFQPPQDAKYEAVDCALKKLKEVKFPGMKLGFIGNERYSNEVEQ